MGSGIVILGARGHARVVASLCRAAGREVAGFLDPTFETDVEVDGVPVLGRDDRLADPDFVAAHEFAVAIGDPAGRCRAGRAVLDAGGRMPPLVHPSAIVDSDVRLGPGVVLLAGAIVNCGSILDEFVLINTAATVDHDGRLAEGTQLGPGAHLAGDVQTGRRVQIGIGASVIQGVRIGDEAVVGAGAAVIRDVEASQTVVGCPAKPIEK